MADAGERLDEYARRPGESVDEYVQRGLRESSGGRRYIADKESDDRRYAADTSYKGTKYSSDASSKASRYSADKGLEGTKYSSDRGLEGTKYRADVDERGNKLVAGNTFLKTYADLSAQPKNYFQAQEYLHNGIGAGYGNFVDDALATGRPARGFVPYVGAFPGNAAQAMFSQGGESDYEMTEEGGDPYGRWVGRNWTPEEVAIVKQWKPGDSIPDGFIGASEIGKDDKGAFLYPSIKPANTRIRVTTPEPPRREHWRTDVEPSTGDTWTRPAYGDPLQHPVTVYDQGGDDGKFARRMPKLDARFSVYGDDDLASQALVDWRRESGRAAPNFRDGTDRANFERYVEDWVGVRRANRGAQMAEDEARRRALPAQGLIPNPYDQGGTNWNTVDTWATGEDKTRLDEMDKAFRPGVHKWGAGYWEGLDDDSKDLWRSYWGYRGLSPRAVEHEVLSSRTGNSEYFGQGRTA